MNKYENFTQCSFSIKGWMFTFVLSKPTEMNERLTKHTILVPIAYQRVYVNPCCQIMTRDMRIERRRSVIHRL